jgi:hypothetical protein
MLYRQVKVHGTLREHIAKVPAGYPVYFDALATTIPPGTAVNTLSFDQDTLLGLQAPPWSMSATDGRSVTRQVYSLATAVNEYVTYNRTIYNPAFPIVPTFTATATSRLGNVPPGAPLNHQVYEMTVPALVTVGFRWDHEMDHTSYNAGTPPTTNWYFTATTVWQFFRDRPQVP